jgi:hypothetical protein
MFPYSVSMAITLTLNVDAPVNLNISPALRYCAFLIIAIRFPILTPFLVVALFLG